MYPRPKTSSDVSSRRSRASSRIAPSSSSARRTASGSPASPSMTASRAARLEIESSDNASATIVIATICEVYALVEATPISHPALMCTPQSVPRAIADPTVLVTPTHKAPAERAYRSAASVSAVSPDCDTNTHASSRATGQRRSIRSEASSSETGTSTSSSTVCRQARQAWYEVPQATNMMRRARRIAGRCSDNPPRVMRCSR